MPRIEITRTFDAYPNGPRETFAAGRILVVGGEIDDETADLWVGKQLARRLSEPKATPREKATDE